MRIDSHQHFWRFDAGRDTWITEEMQVIRRDFLPQHLLPELAANQIDGSIAVQTDQSEAETMFLLELAEAFAEIKGVVGWVDLRARNLTERLEYFSHFARLRGFRHIAQAEADERFLAREEFVAGIRQLQRFGFTYDILVYPHQLPAANELVEKVPQQRFVLDHLAKPAIRHQTMEPWAHQIRRLAEKPNVWCKISGMITEANWQAWRKEDFTPYLDVIFDAFGVDRVLFGSDWPVCLVAGSYREVKALVADYIWAMSADEQEKVFGRNAETFYGLGT